MKGRLICLIPARLDSSRLPAKMLADLNGKPLIRRVYENARRMPCFDAVYIATDSPQIAAACAAFDCPVLMTGSHPSGTSRIAEAVKSLDAEFVVNLQGDEPFLEAGQVESCVAALKEDPQILIATLKVITTDPRQAADANRVKVVCDSRGRALYFSRSPIPFLRPPHEAPSWNIHLGVYVFRREFLAAYPSLTASPAEQMEKLEQLRFLHHGYGILCVDTPQATLGIDTEEDLQQAREILKRGAPD